MADEQKIYQTLSEIAGKVDKSVLAATKDAKAILGAEGAVGVALIRSGRFSRNRRRRLVPI
jgi:hypothetical protein